MSLMIPGTGNEGRVAAYGPAMFGAGATAGAAAPIVEPAFGGALQAGLSGGGGGAGAGHRKSRSVLVGQNTGS